MIYVFGNSHAHFFTDSTPSRIGEGEFQEQYFRSFSLGPVIAYNFYEHHFPMMIDIINHLDIMNEDKILLAVGEVDCRWHIPKQANLQKRSCEAVAKDCIDRFFRAHAYLKDFGYNVIGWGGHPSTTAGHSDIDHSPIYGDCLTRNRTSLFWNDYLEQKCKDKNIHFVSIIRDLINVDGLTKMEYYKDYCHLDSKKLLPSVTEQFRQRGLL